MSEIFISEASLAAPVWWWLAVSCAVGFICGTGSVFFIFRNKFKKEI